MLSRQSHLLVLGLAVAAAGQVVAASPAFDLLFGDHAVLQREAIVPVWGRGFQPGAEVCVRCGAAEARTQAQPDGAFRVRLPAQPAGGPYQLTATAGEVKIVSSDVYVGEVWLASGQSNMEFLMKNAVPAFPTGEYPLIRMFTVAHRTGLEKVHALSEGDWKLATAKNVGDFSAVAGFFALELQKRLGCAVGILHSSWGDTRVETWTSREALLTDPVARPWLLEYERLLGDPALNEKVQAVRKYNDQWTKQCPPASEIADFAKDWASGKDDRGWREVEVPATFEDACMRFLNGAVWFRRQLRLPENFIGKELVLHLGAIDKQDRSFFNGVQVGAMGKGREMEYWDRPRVYPISSSLVKDAIATVAVRAWSGIRAGGMNGPAEEMYLALKDDPTQRLPLSGSGWQTRVEEELKPFTFRPDVFLPGAKNAPYTLFNNMIAPLVGYGIRGAIWYQGCTNTGKHRFDFHYGELLSLMIRDWRRRWGQGDFPFIEVELASYLPAASCVPENTYAIIRQGQREASRTEPNVGLASAIDVGDAGDIHPKDKQTVGQRLARWAFAKVYELETVACGPRLLKSKIVGDQIRVSFSDCGSGLVVKGSPAGIVSPCAIAGQDGEFQLAEGRLEGNILVISSPKVPLPVRACYGWASNPRGLNLYNREGLPASPFMTKAGEPPHP